MRIPASPALAVDAALRLHVARAPLAAARQLARRRRCIAAPAPFSLGLYEFRVL